MADERPIGPGSDNYGEGYFFQKDPLAAPAAEPTVAEQVTPTRLIASLGLDGLEKLLRAGNGQLEFRMYRPVVTEEMLSRMPDHEARRILCLPPRHNLAGVTIPTSSSVGEAEHVSAPAAPAATDAPASEGEIDQTIVDELRNIMVVWGECSHVHQFDALVRLARRPAPDADAKIDKSLPTPQAVHGASGQVGNNLASIWSEASGAVGEAALFIDEIVNEHWWWFGDLIGPARRDEAKEHFRSIIAGVARRPDADAMRKALEALPRTADDVPIVPGMILFSVHGTEWRVNAIYATTVVATCKCHGRTESWSPHWYRANNPKSAAAALAQDQRGEASK